MFGKKTNSNALAVPLIADQNTSAVEILRVWAAPGSPQQITIRTAWRDPGAWGLMLVDVARQVASAYAQEGQDPQLALARIRALFDAEWEKSTDSPNKAQEPTT